MEAICCFGNAILVEQQVTQIEQCREMSRINSKRFAVGRLRLIAARQMKRMGEVEAVLRIVGPFHDRGAHQLAGFVERAALGSDHSKHVERIRMARLVPQRFLIEFLGFGQLATLMLRERRFQSAARIRVEHCLCLRHRYAFRPTDPVTLPQSRRQCAGSRVEWVRGDR